MATKKYTVTLPQELAEAIRAEAGPGGFSRYVTQAIEHRREQDRLGEAVAWWEQEYGEVTEAELAEAEAERREIERQRANLPVPGRRPSACSGRSVASCPTVPRSCP